jgi:peptidoglycan hydrolase-like protein with peptidoglycan-binding domain
MPRTSIDPRALVAAAAIVILMPAAEVRAAPLLRLGAEGAEVGTLQRDLGRLRFLPAGAASARFDMRTWHAVVAFQGWNRLARDGAVGPQTRHALRRAKRPEPWSRRTGFEVHVDRQVLLLIRKRHVHRAVHVSTGAGGRTPLGRFGSTGASG